MADTNRRQFIETCVGLPMLTILQGDSLSSTSAKVLWAKRRREVLSRMELVMGSFPIQKRKPPLDLKMLESDDLPTVTRRKILYASEEGDRTPGYLLRPRKLKGKVPGILCLHPTVPAGAADVAGIVVQDLAGAYALELAERGYVTLAPDYPDLPIISKGFGGYVFDSYRHGYQSQTMKGIWNHMRGVDLLQSLPEVDPQRIGCVGHSLGGHNTLFTGAFDPRIQVLISSCGFTSFKDYHGGELAGWSKEVYMPLIAVQRHNNPADMPFDFSDVLIALAPRPLFINAPLHDQDFDITGVRETLALVRPIYENDFHAGDRLVAVHPNCVHSFPPDIRHQAYEFLDKWLKA